MAIQLGAALLVWLYYNQPAIREWAVGVAQIKTSWGLGFSFLAGAVAGGVIPEIAKFLTGRLKEFDRQWAGKSLFNAFAYGIIAAQVDLFYRLQAVLFGEGTDIQTLIIKTAVDMVFFATLVSIPTAVLLYEWQKNGFAWKPVFRSFGKGFVWEKIAPALLPCWAFWTPVLFCVYAMPRDLQFPLSVLAEAAWSILFIFIATEEIPAPQA